MKINYKQLWTSLAIIAPLALGLASCKKEAASGNETTANAVASYVPPGQKDEYYLLYSGGHSGQVFVAGIPSMRHIATIPVFAPYPGTGYGFDVETKKMLGDYTWGDMHHPGLSQTNGEYDGRWLFVNDNANNRIARIDLRDFKTRQILGPVPNSSGNHGSSFVTENTEHVLMATRFSIPLPKGCWADLNDYAKEFNAMVSCINVDRSTSATHGRRRCKCCANTPAGCAAFSIVSAAASGRRKRSLRSATWFRSPAS